MPAIMGFEEWKRRTYKTIGRRSTELKALDNAIENFHKREKWRAESEFLKEDFKRDLQQADLLKVDEAFGAWKSSHGLSYMSSGRNADDAIEELEAQLRAARVLTRKEAEAFAALEAMRNESLQNIFGGSQLQWKSLIKSRKLDLLNVGTATASLGLYTKDVVRIARGAKVKTIGARHRDLASSSGRLKSELVKMSFGPDALGQLGVVIDQLITEWLRDFIAAITPWFGVAASGATALIATAGAVSGMYSEYTLSQARPFIRSGDPSVAADALKRMLERAINANLRAAGRATAELGGKLTSMFVDGGAAVGPAIGAASAFAALIDSFMQIGREWQEMKKVNRLLSTSESLNSDLFTTCPLLGAYYLSTASDFEIMSLLTEDFGRANWQDTIEQVKRQHIGPLQELASSYVFNSRFALIDSSGAVLKYRGTVTQNVFDKMFKKMGLWK